MNYVNNLNEIEYVVNIMKIFIVILGTHYIELRMINKIISRKENVILFFIFMILSMICEFFKKLYGFTYYVLFLILILSIIELKIYKNNIAESIILTTISLSVNYILFFLGVGISFIPNVIFKINNNVLSLTIIIIFYILFIYLFSRMKRFSKGIIFLRKGFQSEYIEIVVLNLSVIILFYIILLSNYIKSITAKMGFSFIIFSIIMFITIQKSLQLYYKQKLQERETEEIKEELKNKNKEIKELEKENLELNKKNHSIAHKQKALEYELNQIKENNNQTNNSDIKNKIENLSKEIQNENIYIELKKTNMNKIDNMLKYMQSECIKNKTDFQLQVNGNIHHMTNKYIKEEDLEILIADLIKNAIIAINHTENINKSILVRLGIIDGAYSLYIYDSGIEFKIDTLLNLGLKPSTTHKDEGGTGMGLMNIFNTLKKYKASLIIDEYGKPILDNFTKVIKVIFDNNQRYEINSYRQKEIKEKDVDKRIHYTK